MEINQAIDIQERIEQAVSNIETIEKEAISFSKTRKELQEVAKSLVEHIEIQKTQLLDLQQLVNSVKSTLVEETLVKFEQNVEKMQIIVNELYNNISENILKLISETKQELLDNYKKQSKSTSTTLVIFGIVTFAVVLTNVVLNLFVL